MEIHARRFTNKLQGKRVLIFGGTSGIGYAVAEACIEHGCTLIISGSNAPKLASTVQRLRKSYPQIESSQLITHACDLSRKEKLDSDIQKLLAVVTESAKGKIDHVVFTAGDTRPAKSLAMVTVVDYETSQMVRNVAPLIVAKHLPQYMEIGPDSSYTITGGFITTKPPPGFALYAATGVEGLSRALAVEMAPIRVNLVAPGAIKTQALDGVPEAVIDGLTQATTTKRLGRPEDIAEAYVRRFRHWQHSSLKRWKISSLSAQFQAIAS